ncbi:MAG: ABC transporter ATP-binding protein [Elusimicrobiota bacterium]
MRFLRRIWPYWRKYRRAYAGGLSLVLVGTILAVVSPWIIKAAIDLLESGNPGGAIGSLALALVCIAAGRSFMVFHGRFTIIAASRRIEYDLRDKLFRKLARLAPAYFDRHASGDLESRVVNDVEGVRMVVGVATMMTVTSGLLFVLSIGSMFILNAKLAAITLVPLALVALLTTLLTKRIYRQSEEVQDRLADISTLAQENFTGARVIRAFTQEDFENRKFGGAAERYRKANMALALTRGWTWGMMALLIDATIGVTLLIGGMEIIRGTLTKGEFVAFAAYEFMLGWPVIAMGWVITISQRGAACMERIETILSEPEPPAIPDAASPEEGMIEIRDLTFRYAEDRLPALAGLSIKIKRGERIAIVGRTGSGKSTLIQLLLGLYEVPDGKIFIDGKDINAIPRPRLRAALGCVPQDTFLFSDSIYRNIAFGARGEPDELTVRRAAEGARLTDDLAEFPNGIDQVIGERGITLSGGQKQRTAIARALIRDPRILLLDDALSSVDVHTEKAILDHLDAYFHGRTCLIVTHRFSVVAKVDRILVLDDGRLVEEGTHSQLMRRQGLYAALVSRQRLEQALKKS